MLTIGLLLGATLVVAFANGANDNFKGVATLYGSGVVSYRAALMLGTVSTALGSMASVLVAMGLIDAFTGKGLVPDAALTTSLLTAVALAAALTVVLATRFGLPVSTTHALVGGLVGAGYVAAGSSLNLGALGTAFVMPLLASPVLAVLLSGTFYAVGRWGRQRLGVEAETCVCIGEEWIPLGDPRAPSAARTLGVMVSTPAQCERRYTGRIAGVSAQTVATVAHVSSASLVGFSRGLNDTPKILGLLVGTSILSPWAGALAITAAMAAGGITASRRVAKTLAHRITTMNPGQGLAGNLCTSMLVAAASRFGMPVSTTHVATGSIFGIGAAGADLRWKMTTAVLAAWVATLPLAAALGAIAMWVLR